MVQSNLCNPRDEPEIVRQRSTPSWKRKLIKFCVFHESCLHHLHWCLYGLGKTSAIKAVHGEKVAAAQLRDPSRGAQSEGSGLKSLVVSEKTIKVRASCPG